MYAVWHEPKDPSMKRREHIFLCCIPDKRTAQRIATELAGEGFVKRAWTEED